MKIPFTLLIALFFVSVSAQQFRTTITEKYENKSSFGQTIELSNSHLHLLRTQKAPAVYMSVGVRRTDNEDRKVFGETADRIKIREPLGVRLQKAGDWVYLVYQEMGKKGEVGNIMVSELDTLSLALKEPKVLGNLEKAGYSARVNVEGIRGYQFFWKHSPDKKKIMALVSNDASASEYYVAVFDPELRMIWEGKQVLQAPANEVLIKDAAIDNDGNVYLAYRVVPKTRRANMAELNRVVINNNNRKISDLKIDLGSNIAHEIRLLPAANGSGVHVGGYYAEDHLQPLKGSYYSKISNLQLGPTRKEAFPAALLEQFAGDRWADKNKGLFYTITTSVLELEDGSLNMTGEFRSTDQGTRGNLIVYSGSILNTYFGTAKTSFTRIPKFRVSAGSTVGDSYSAFPYGDKLIIFYNDKEENLSKDPGSSPDRSSNYSNVVMVAAVIQPSGELSRHKVVDLQKEDYVAITNLVQRRDDRFYVPNYKVKALGGITDDFRLAIVETY